MKGFIYKITNNLNGKIYIGQTIQNPIDRWYRHCQKSNLNKNEANMAIKRAIFKYGKNNFTFKVIETLDNYTKELLDEREVYWISFYNSYEEGYNCTKGGNSGAKPLKIAKSEYNDIIELYKLGASLRNIAKEYNVDKATIKHILVINDIELHTTRSYKYSSEEREKIIDLYVSIYDTYGTTLSRLIVQNRFRISRSYLIQLLSGDRRI